MLKLLYIFEKAYVIPPSSLVLNQESFVLQGIFGSAWRHSGFTIWWTSSGMLVEPFNTEVQPCAGNKDFSQLNMPIVA